MSDADVFNAVAHVLEQAEVPSMLTGSFASSIHGQARATRGIDFVIDTDEPGLRLLVRLLVANGYYADVDAALDALRTETQFNAIDPASGWKIDFIIRRNRPFSIEEFARRQAVVFEGRTVHVASAEDVIIAKLEWAKRSESTRQIDDVAGILRVAGSELQREYVERWVSELGVAVEWEAALRETRS